MKKQDEEFYREIYHLHNKDVRSFLNHYFPGIGQKEAGDIIREVWVQFGLEIASARKRTRRENLSWLFAVTKDKSVAWIRKNARSYRREKKKEACVSAQEIPGDLPQDEEKTIAERILQELSQEEIIFSGNEFYSPETGRKKEQEKTCKGFQLHRKLEKKMRETEFLPWREW